MSIVQQLQQSTVVLKFLDYYAGLESRDRLALKLLAGFLIPVMVVFAVLLPVTRFFDEALENYHAAQQDYQWISSNAPRASTIKPSSLREAGQSLFGVANGSAKGFQLSFKRYEPIGDNALSLWLENVNFNNLVLWLERLDKRHGITVREIAVERKPTDGLVDVRLVLQG